MNACNVHMTFIASLEMTYKLRTILVSRKSRLEFNGMSKGSGTLMTRLHVYKATSESWDACNRVLTYLCSSVM